MAPECCWEFQQSSWHESCMKNWNGQLKFRPKIMKTLNFQDTGQEETIGSNAKSETFRIEANGKYDSDRKLTQVAIISCIPELDFERSTFLSFSIIILEFHKDEHQRVCRMPDMNTIDHFIFNSYEYNIAFKSSYGSPDQPLVEF